MKSKHSVEFKTTDPKSFLTIFCSECPFKAVSSEYLKNHVKKEHPNIEIKTVLCDICFQTVFKHNLEFHKIEHHPLMNITKKKISCDFCNAELCTKRWLREHIKKIHPELQEEKVECDICLSHFYKSELQFHKKSKHEGKRFRCDYCGGEFQNLPRHIACVHPEFTKKTVQCLICLKFYTEKHINIHISKMHEEKELFCNNCGLMFSTVWYLQEHMKYCSPKNCRICGILFKSWDEENDHMLKFHPHNF